MKAEVLRKSILQMAIQGKLVPQNSSDEPASVLLQKIRAEKEKLIKEGKIKRDKTDSVIFKGEDGKFYEKTGKEVKDITEHLPFEIPNNWVWFRAVLLVNIISGVSYDKKDVTNQGIRILRGGNINNQVVTTYDNDVFLPIEYHDDEKEVKKDDIIIVASTGSKSVIGKAGFVNQDLSGTQIGAFLRIVRLNYRLIFPYIKIIFSSEYYREHIRELVQGTNISKYPPLKWGLWKALKGKVTGAALKRRTKLAYRTQASRALYSFLLDFFLLFSSHCLNGS